MARDIELDDKDESILEDLLGDSAIVQRLVNDYGSTHVQSLLDKFDLEFPDDVEAEDAGDDESSESDD